MRMRPLSVFAALFLAVLLISSTVFAVDESSELVTDSSALKLSDADILVDFTDINGGGIDGFVDKVSCGTLEKMELEGRTVLKYIPDPNSDGKDSMISFECHNIGPRISKTISFEQYKYISVEYYYASDAPSYKGKPHIYFANSNKVFEKGGSNVNGDALVTNRWATTVFPMYTMDKSLNSTDTIHILNHFHLRMFGSSVKTGALKPSDVIYIGKIGFHMKNPRDGSDAPAETLQPLPSDGLGSVSPSSTETPSILGDINGAVPKYTFDDDVTVDFTVLSNGPGFDGFVDKKDMGTMEKVTVNGRSVIKYTPNPFAAGASSNVSFECFNLTKKIPTPVNVDDYKYISVEYYYDTDTPSYIGEPHIYITSSNKIFKSGGFTLSAAPIETNKWTIAYFPLHKATLNLNGDSNHYLNHIHLRMFGSNKTAAGLKTTDVIYVGRVTFHKSNPNPKTELKICYDRGNIAAKGEEYHETVKVIDGTFRLAECGYSLDGYRFIGWKSEEGETLPAGSEVIISGEEDINYKAVWSRLPEKGNSVGFLYSELFTEIADKADTANIEIITENGIPAVSVTPKKASSDMKIILDAFGHTERLNIDLDIYKYISVIYKTAGDTLPEEANRPHLYITRNSGLLKNGSTPRFIEVHESGSVWKSAVFEIPSLTDNYTDKYGSHMLGQFHVYAFGDKLTASQLPEDVQMIIQGIVFHKEKPKTTAFASSYINGFEDGTFGVSLPMSRAQACTVVARILAGQEGNIGMTESRFDDVSENMWYAKYIAYCDSKGLLSSYGGSFTPDKNITRAELAELVFNMGLVKASDTSKEFTDVSTDHPRYNIISAASSAGLINGYPEADGTYTFRPDNDITRAEVITVINRALGRVSDLSETMELNGVFNDITTDHWAYPAITDAAVSHSFTKEMDGSITWCYAEDKVLIVPEDLIHEGEQKLSEVLEYEKQRIDEIRNSKTTIEVTGTKYYVSSDGDDSNDGLTPENAKKTIDGINRIKLVPGDGIFFRRGDIFRGSLQTVPGVTYSSYGDGEKPVLTVSPQNFAGEENWEQTSVENVWKLKTTVKHDVGVIVFDDTYFAEKRIKGDPGFEDASLVKLEKDLTFWHDVSSISDIEGVIYLRSDLGNPGSRFNSIEVAPREKIVKALSNVTIDNLCFKYTGSHAVSTGAVFDLRVQNCEFGWIGGSRFRESGNSRYGNAIEVYGECNGFYVDNCLFYQIFDAAVTHQYTEGADMQIIMKDIEYTDNVITNTVYPVEYFIHKPSDGIDHYMQNVKISGNLILRTGFGFGDTRYGGSSASCIKSWNTYNEADNFVIDNNIFALSKCTLLEVGASQKAWMPRFSGNTYIQYVYSDFGNIGVHTRSKYDLGVRDYIIKASPDRNAKVYYIGK